MRAKFIVPSVLALAAGAAPALAQAPTVTPVVYPLDLGDVGTMLMEGIGGVMVVFVPIAIGVLLLRRGIKWVTGKAGGV